MTIALVMLLRPFVYLVMFVLVIAPLTWLLYKFIPPGRVKLFLFRVRSGRNARKRDKVIMALAVILAYVVLGLVLWSMDLLQ